jgi:nicotinamidase-related amidase
MARYRLRGKIPCLAGTPGVETLPFGREEPGETVLVKHTFDGFFNSSLLEILKRKEKRFLLTAGLITSTCVLFTTTSAMQHGFLTTLVADCCADEPAAHEQTLQRYPFIFGRVQVSEIPASRAAWTEQIQKLAAWPSALS